MLSNNIEKAVEEAISCNDKGTVSLIIKLEEVEDLVKSFKNLCPSVMHKVTMDWDDESLYRIRFNWESGKFGKPVKIAEPLPLPKTTPPETPRSNHPRYGGPRW